MRVMNAISFGYWLKASRKALDLTQEQLGERVGYSGRTIEKLESDARRPSRAIALGLAEVFRVPEGERDAFVQFARSPQGAGPAAQPDHDQAAPWRKVERNPNNLPAPRTGFIGREQLIASAVSLLSRPDVRLVTLQGPPGVGKTRLSLQLASRLLPGYPDGAFFVPLGSVRDPEQVVPSIALALGLRESAGRPLLSQVGASLRDKRMLLVLDNFEQVAGAAPYISSLLEAAPALKVLVSSRSSLHLYGEYIFPVAPLPVPDPDGVLTMQKVVGYDSIGLFAERAFAANPGFVVGESNISHVARICGSVDGLPLAIELAASRTGTMSPAEIVEKLGARLELLSGGPVDLPDRQRTLRAAIDWSYDLLSEEERLLFRCMSIFAGGASHEALEQIAPDLSEETLKSLVDKSLLVQETVSGEVRTGMLETLREYAWEGLQAHDEVEGATERHEQYFLAMAEEAQGGLRGQEQAAWLARLEREHGNLRAALASLIERGRAAEALRLSSSLWTFWHLRGYPSEGLRWLQDALAMDAAGSPGVPPEVLGNAYNAAGNLAWTASNYETAREMHSRALEVRRKVGDRLKIGDSLNNLGIIALTQHDYGSARLLFEQCFAIYLEVDDKAGAASALNNLGAIYLAAHDFDATLTSQGKALELWSELGSDFGMGVSLNITGEAERFQGNYRKAYKLYKTVLKTYRKLGFKRGLAYTLHNMGHAALGLGEIDEATVSLHESLALCVELQHDEGIVMCLSGLGRALLLRGEHEDAARLLGAVGAALEGEGVLLHPLEVLNYEKSVVDLKRALDGRTGTLMEEGRALGLAQAAAQARLLTA